MKKSFKTTMILLLILISILFFSACGGTSAQETFTANLKSVLLDMKSNTNNISSLQADILFNPSADVDLTRSNSMVVNTEISNASSPDEKIVFTSEMLMDAKSGDASQVVSIGMNSEKAQSGGIYFTGNKMLIKRGNTDKKMIQYTLTEDIANSLMNLAPTERLNKLISSELINTTDEQYTTDVEAYIASIIENTTEEDYTSDIEAKSILGKESELSYVALNIKGEKAKQFLVDLLTLLNEDSDVNSVFDSTQNDSDSAVNEIEKAIKSLKNLSDSEIESLELTFKVQALAENAFGFEIIASSGNKTLSFINNQYTNGFEEQQEMKLVNFNGSGIEITYNNILQEGDKYTGSFNYQLINDKGAKKDSIATQWSSTNTEQKYTSNYQYNIKMYEYSDGEEDVYKVSGNMDWQQTKDGSGNVTGSGSGDVNLTISNETQELLLNMSLVQKYEDVTISAPEFISKAGISVDTSDELISALDIDKDEYMQQNDVLKTLSGIILLLY
jgi:hypothetical protein